MKNTAIMIVRFFAPEKVEYEIEVPLDISAYELFVALNEAFGLNYDVSIKETCYLRTESPIAFLVGDRLLSDYSLRNGTIINMVNLNFDTAGKKADYLKDFDFSKVSYDCVIDLSERQNITIGNEPQYNLFNTNIVTPKVRVELVNQDNTFFLKADKGTSISYNGRVFVFDDMPLQVRNFDFINILSGCFYFHNKMLYIDRKSDFQINGVKCSEISEGISNLRYPKFVRNSRLKLKINDEPISLLAPKEKPAKPKNNLFLKLMPAVGMIAMTVLLRGVMGGTNISFLLFSVGSVSMGAVVSVLTIINEKKEYNQQIVDREIGYRKYIDEKKAEIENLRKEELKLLNRIYYHYDETSAFAKNFSGSLFDRISSDEDFLEIRIGTGTIDSARKIDYKPQETYESDDDELVDLPVQVSEQYEKLSDAPILVQLKDANVIGVVGSDKLLYEMMKVIYFDLCIRQHYDDVMTFLVIDEESTGKYGWIKWFRHINSDKFRNIVCDSQSKSAIFEYLYSELNRREESKDKEHKPHIVVFVMNDFGIKEHPVSKYIEKASEYGATFIFFENYRDYIPIGCSQLVLIDSDSEGRIIKNENTEIVKFTYVKIPDSDLYTMSYKLAPVYCEEVSLEGTLTKNITLYQLLGILSADELNLNKRWVESDTTKSMKAPIGVRAGNETVYLDIHDKADGPHGLVAGTTGSGKSEVLMTYILSMATLYSPYEVAFLIIDFKGGGMGNQFRKLPHTLGVITDIDGKEIKRSLISIKAEIERRKRLFAIAGVDHINKYIKAWKGRKVKTPLPHLIIIVDEFAELKSQFPDFMAELNSTARVGRSLGVHLILATQKPQGQVDPQIDSNSKFRLCLKVQTPEDSREVIKTPLAAEIREAGRAYMMIGNNEVFELFQSAYSGASADIGDSAGQKEFTISSVDFAGRRTPLFVKKRKKTEDGEKFVSQKDAITEYIIDFFRKSGLPKLPDICQPPLSKRLEYVLHKRNDNTGIYADLGIFDDPEQQRQEVYSVNIATQHMLIIGALQMGKTNVLQLIIRNLAEKYSPDEVNFYIIDYSSMILTSFQNLAHVGGVVVPNEDEKLKNLFKLLNEEVSSRKKKFKSAGVSSFSAYKETGASDLPLIVLMIDNYAYLKELSFNDNTNFFTILRDGLSVGISVVIANGSTKSFDYKYLSSFSCRIALYHNSSDEYGKLFETYRLSVDDIPGRCLISKEKKILDCQLYQSFDIKKESERSERIRSFAGELNMEYPAKKARLIPQIPEPLIEKDIRQQYSDYFSPYNVIIGFDYDSLLPMKLNLSGLNLIVSGTPKSGKGNFVEYLLSSLLSGKDYAPVEIVIFDKATVKKFSQTASKETDVVRYEISSVNMSEICKEWKAELESRKKLVVENNGEMDILKNKPLLFMICEDSSKEMLANFDESLLTYSSYKFSLVVSDVKEEINAIRTPKLSKIQNAGANFLLFGSFVASNVINGFIKISMQEKRERFSYEVSAGDAFYVEAIDQTRVYRLKTPMHSQY